MTDWIGDLLDLCNIVSASLKQQQNELGGAPCKEIARRQTPHEHQRETHDHPIPFAVLIQSYRDPPVRAPRRGGEKNAKITEL